MGLTLEKLIKFDLLEEAGESLTGLASSRLVEYFELSQEIKSIDQFINETPSFPGSTDKIRRSELNLAIGATLAIEGTTLTSDEIEETFRKVKHKESLKRKEQEAENSRKVYDYIIDLANREKKEIVYSEQIIKQIHKYFTDNMNYISNVPGDYRGDFSVTFGDPRRPSLCLTRSDVEIAMSKFVSWLKKEGSGILTSGIIPKAIMSHYYLTEIHPFGDGNGRTARALEALVLYKNGINHYCFWSLANFWSANKSEYINHLGNIRATGDPLDFILWGMEGYLGEIKRIKSLVLTKLKQLMFMDYVRYLLREKKKQEIKINQRIVDVLNLLLKRGRTSISDFTSSPEVVALYSNVSKPTTYRDFKKMFDLRLVLVAKENSDEYIDVNYKILEKLSYSI